MENRRKTVQRQLIIEAVKNLNIHATAEQVFEYIVKTHPSISKATVYRNLNLMAEAGELLNIGSIYGSAHYDYNCNEHCHFICKDCRRVFDINSANSAKSTHISNLSNISNSTEEAFSDIAVIINRIEKTDGFNITDYKISFSGLCRECKTKE
jgi:Fe2+ or Zn2+ uptake regulation protein